MLALLDDNAPLEIDGLFRQIGYSPLRLPPHPQLPFPVASHPDMLLFFAPHAIYCTESYAAIAKNELSVISEHTHKKISLLDTDYGSEYPKDVLLNAFAIKDRLFCHLHATAHEIRELYANGLIPVAQGYAKCSAVPIGNRALITADASIASKAMQAGLDILRIREGHIRLEGYEYGFIGGCTSFAPYKEMNDVYFCGSLYEHPNAHDIIAFCAKHGCRAHSLGKFPLTDIGTVFLI